MKTIYLDNAATTALRPEVVAEMSKVLLEDYGNPSSTHAMGRHAKSILEMARKSIAACLGCSAQEILFTSGATEANNWILRNAVQELGVARIISTRIEHHAVLETVEQLQHESGIELVFLDVDSAGHPDLAQLDRLLSEKTLTLVSLMHVNNETGTVLDLNRVGEICRDHGAFFHSDTVQSVGKTEIDLKQLPIDFAVASAHKFHGPKGVGFAYVRKGLSLRPLLFGGEQEKGIRAGTEAVHNIAGMAKALELSYTNLENERAYITGLKEYTIKVLSRHFEGVKVNGDAQAGFYNILNACLPLDEQQTAMILFHLDMKGIAVSRGSACQSGSVKPSHVLEQLLSPEDLRKPSLRISFSHYNTEDDIDFLVEALGLLKG